MLSTPVELPCTRFVGSLGGKGTIAPQCMIFQHLEATWLQDATVELREPCTDFVTKVT